MARKCGMVSKQQRIILVEAYPAQETLTGGDRVEVPSYIEWKVAEDMSDIEEENDYQVRCFFKLSIFNKHSF